MNTLTNLNTFPIGNSLDGINIITDEIENTALLVDGSNYMLADLNMNNQVIKKLNSGVDSLDAVNKSQLDLKADTTYVNTQLALKADKIYVDASLNLKANTTYVNTQLGQKADTSYVNTQLGLKADKTYVDSNFVNLTTNQTIAGTKTFSNQVIFNATTKTNLTANDIPNAGTRQWLLTSAQTFTGTKTFQNGANLNAQKIVSLAVGTDGTDAVNKNQLDVKADTTYVNTQLGAKADTTYVDSQDALKVNKAGDTMTGVLQILKNNTSQLELKSNLGSVISESSGIKFNHTSKDVGLIEMKTIDTAKENGGMTFKVISNNALQTLLYMGYDGISCNKELNLNYNKIKYLDDGTNFNDAVNKGQLDLKADKTYVDNQDNLKVNKAGDTMTGTLNLNEATNSRNIVIKPKQETYNTGGGDTINRTRYNYVRFNFDKADGGTSSGRQWCISAQDDAGSIDVSALYFRCGSGGTDATRLILGHLNITANVPIIRNAWNSGEIIQTKIYNQSTNGSGILDVAGGNNNNSISLWKDLPFTMLNTTTDSNVLVEVSAPFHLSGGAQDVIYIQLRDFTNSTEQEFGFSSAYYGSNEGGGYRSGSFLPYFSSYTPTANTGNKTRSIQIRFNNLSNDTLSICKYKDPNNNLNNKDLWTVRITEYKK